VYAKLPSVLRLRIPGLHGDGGQRDGDVPRPVRERRRADYPWHLWVCCTPCGDCAAPRKRCVICQARPDLRVASTLQERTARRTMTTTNLSTARVLVSTRKRLFDGYELVMIGVMIASTVTFWFVH
jgi:hypothetical protein